MPGVGQYENIGDLMLRRPLLDELRRHGVLHVYTGTAPDGYLRGLRLSPADVVYTSFREWHGALWAAALRRTADYAFKPGEIQLTAGGMKEHLGMLPALLAVRATGGHIIRVGSGARSFPPTGRALIAPSLAVPHLTRWRDTESARLLGRGAIMPDLAFASDPPAESAQRRLLVVSMRGDRPAPSDAWFDGLAELAGRLDLALFPVSQVARDDELTRRMASRWESDSLTWDGIDHVAQEEGLRAAYRSAAVVASDRLHVLIAATTEGAQPIAPLTEPAHKIDRHFAAAGLPSVSVLARGLGPDELALTMLNHLETTTVTPEHLAAARSALREVFEDVARLMGAAE